jgi:hypothetical protein
MKSSQGHAGSLQASFPVEEVHVEVEIFDRFNPGFVKEFDSNFTGEGKKLSWKDVSVTSARN